jgi:hypothetical protein
MAVTSASDMTASVSAEGRSGVAMAQNEPFGLAQAASATRAKVANSPTIGDDVIANPCFKLLILIENANPPSAPTLKRVLTKPT